MASPTPKPVDLKPKPLSPVATSNTPGSEGGTPG